MKIGILVYSKGNKGGAERRYFHLIRELSKEQTVFILANSSVFDFWSGLGGFGNNVVREVLIRDPIEVSSAAGGEDGKTGRPPGIRSVIGKAVPRRVKSSLPVYWTTLKLNWKVLRWSRRTGITHLNALQGAAILAVGARLHGCRIVFSYVDYMVENGYPFRWITNHGLKTVIRISYRYDFLSGMIPKRMIDRGLDLDESRVRIPPASFTDFERFKPLARKNRKIVFSGRLEDLKNPFLALRVAETLKRENVDFTMSILGRGRLTRPLMAYVELHRLKDRVRIGYTNAVEDELKDALIFLSLQKENNYPSQSLLEAMASGCVPIATDVGETRKIVDDEIGFLVPQNAETIAQIIRGIFRNKSFYEGRASTIRKSVETRFGVKQYLSYYRSLFEN